MQYNASRKTQSGITSSRTFLKTTRFLPMAYLSSTMFMPHTKIRRRVSLCGARSALRPCILRSSSPVEGPWRRAMVMSSNADAISEISMTAIGPASWTLKVLSVRRRCSVG